MVFVFRIVRNHSESHQSGELTSSSDVSWKMDKSGTWVATGTPPACPEPPIFTMPVDISTVTAILYPGQVRGDAYKYQGGFHFGNQADNNVTVSVPLDAKVVRGSHGFRSGEDMYSSKNGEDQYSFELIAPCGIWYSFGHLLKLSPKFQAMADKLPLIKGFAKQQIFDIDPQVDVKKGEVIATAVGYAKTHNVFADWGVLDLRHKNGFTISPEWADKYGQEFDEYAVCGFELLPPADTAYLKALRSGSVESGTKSDYCH